MKKTIAFVSILAFALSATPALAFWQHNSNDLDIYVKNSNSATVNNTVTTVADTGSNTANGGKATSEAKSKGGNATSDANGGDGGSITTGDAGAVSTVDNTVNTNKTKIEIPCGCVKKGDTDIKVKNYNSATVNNTVATVADTGSNTANGGKAKSEARSKSAKKSYGHHHAPSPASNATSDADGGNGGDITTGDAGSISDVVNVINSNVTRIN